MAGLSDSQLLERFLTRYSDGDELAFATIVERHGPMVLRVCRRVLADPHDVEDAFQATFLVLVKKASTLRRQDSLACWLHGVAFRVASCARAASIRRRLHERKGGIMPGSEKPEIGDDLSTVLHEELTRLPEKLRAPVVLCHLQGRTYEEAAARLRCPIGTVKSRLARARERLQARLAARGYAPATLAIASAFATEAEASLVSGVLIESTVRAALQFAARPAEVTGAISATVAALTEGVLKTMAMTHWKSLAVMGLSLAAMITSGVAVQAQFGNPNTASASADDDSDATPRKNTKTLDAPALDRLKEVESKLDRLLRVLENPLQTRPPLSQPVRDTADAAPSAAPSAPAGLPPATVPATPYPLVVTPAAPATPAAPVPPAPPVAAAPPLAAAPPVAAPSPVGAAPAAAPLLPQPPGLQPVPEPRPAPSVQPPAAWASSKSPLEIRIESLERELAGLKQRLLKLEKTTDRPASTFLPATASNPNNPADVSPPARRTPRRPQASDSLPLPTNSPFDSDLAERVDDSSSADDLPLPTRSPFDSSLENAPVEDDENPLPRAQSSRLKTPKRHLPVPTVMPVGNS